MIVIHVPPRSLRGCRGLSVCITTSALNVSCFGDVLPGQCGPWRARGGQAHLAVGEIFWGAFDLVCVRGPLRAEAAAALPLHAGALFPFGVGQAQGHWRSPTPRAERRCWGCAAITTAPILTPSARRSGALGLPGDAAAQTVYSRAGLCHGAHIDGSSGASACGQALHTIHLLTPSSWTQILDSGL